MNVEKYLSIAEGARLSKFTARPWFSGKTGFEITLPTSQPIFSKLSAALANNEFTEEELARLIDRDCGFDTRTVLAVWLEVFVRCGILKSTLKANGIPIATRLGLSAYSSCADKGPFDQLCLSRFSYCRLEANHFVIESPRSSARVILYDPRAFSVLEKLREPLALNGSYLKSSRIARSLVQMFQEVGMVVPYPETRHSCWEFHDFLFHTWYRYGQSMLPYGLQPQRSSVRMEEIEDSSERVIKLPHPCSGDRLKAKSLAQVLRLRKSIRRHARVAISKAELSHFLYWSAYLGKEETGARYPSPGGRYPLTIYLVLGRSADLEKGLYRYQAKRHELVFLREFEPPVAQLFSAYVKLGKSALKTAQAVLVMTTNHRKVADYRRVGLANTLKELGGLYQTMYLVATAMGLAPCALGGGNSNAFSRIVSTQPEEVSIGEFLIGTRAEKN